MMMIVGWKSIAKVSGFHERTIKKWHYERKRLPLSKSTSRQQGKVMVLDAELYQWLKSMKNWNGNTTMSRR